MSHPPVRLTRPTRPHVSGRWALALWMLATLGICPLAHAGVTAVAEPANVPLKRADQDAPTVRDTGSDADWAQLLRGLRAAAQAEAPPRLPAAAPAAASKNHRSAPAGKPAGPPAPASSAATAAWQL